MPAKLGTIETVDDVICCTAYFYNENTQTLMVTKVPSSTYVNMYVVKTNRFVMDKSAKLISIMVFSTYVHD